MQVLIAKDYGELSRKACEVVASAIRRKPTIVLGLATGSTPEGLYAELVKAHQSDGLDFSQVVTFNLDEYVGLEPGHPQSYRHFMDEHLFSHVNVQAPNTHVPDGMAECLSAHCEEYERRIKDAGGIDLQVLGLGRDGHVAFNEPGTALGSRTHVTALMPETIEDNSRFFDSPDEVPRFAVTMGVGTILEARRCLLLVSGANKAEAARDTIEGPVTSMVTASALQLHHSTVAIVDEPAASQLSLADFYRWQHDHWSMIADKL